MKQQKNIPALRFPGFTGEWEQKKLGEVGNFIGGGTPPTKNVEFWNGSIPWISSSDLKEDSIYQIRTTRFITEEAISSSAAKLVPQKSILIVSRVGVGKVAINENELCTSQDFTSLSPYTDNYIFLAYIVKLKTNSLLELNQGTSIKGFVKSDLETLDIKIPTLPEQQKIAAFLTAIDEKLQCLKQQKALLEQYKKGVMQQLFSGQLRFKDAKGKDFPDWEEKRLGEVCEIVGGGTPETNKEEYWNGGIQWFTPTEIKSDYISNSIRTITELGLQKSSAKKLPAGTILLTTRATIGEVSIALQECSTNQGFQSLIVNEENNNIFLFNWIKMNKHELMSRANGSTFPEISKSEIEKIIAPFPSLPEQTAIAQFLSALDNKIAHTQQQIAQTEQWKKGLLQQLFV
jgi:type I restriction enzyme, S subunit